MLRELEREMVEAALLADVEQEQIVMMIRRAAAQEVAAARIAVARDEAEPLRVERHDLVGLVDHEHRVRHLERRGRLEELRRAC